MKRNVQRAFVLLLLLLLLLAAATSRITCLYQIAISYEISGYETRCEMLHTDAFHLTAIDLQNSNYFA